MNDTFCDLEPDELLGRHPGSHFVLEPHLNFVLPCLQLRRLPAAAATSAAGGGFAVELRPVSEIGRNPCSNCCSCSCWGCCCYCCCCSSGCCCCGCC